MPEERRPKRKRGRNPLPQSMRRTGAELIKTASVRKMPEERRPKRKRGRNPLPQSMRRTGAELIIGGYHDD